MAAAPIFNKVTVPHSGKSYAVYVTTESARGYLLPKRCLSIFEDIIEIERTSYCLFPVDKDHSWDFTLSRRDDGFTFEELLELMPHTRELSIYTGVTLTGEQFHQVMLQLADNTSIESFHISDVFKPKTEDLVYLFRNNRALKVLSKDPPSPYCPGDLIPLLHKSQIDCSRFCSSLDTDKAR